MLKEFLNKLIFRGKIWEEKGKTKWKENRTERANRGQSTLANAYE